MDNTQGNIIIALLVLIAVLVAGKRITWLRYDTGGDAVKKQEGSKGETQTTKSVSRLSQDLIPFPETG